MADTERIELPLWKYDKVGKVEETFPTLMFRRPKVENKLHKKPS